MFTGIIEGIGQITDISENVFTITHPFETPFPVGDSICLDGMCSTVLESSEYNFSVEIIAQSRSLTSFGTIQPGAFINLERSAVIGQDRNAGHYVTGHIDGLAEVLSVMPVDDYQRIRVHLPAAFAHLVVEKGSVTLQGVALTVAAVGDTWYEVCIIGHTWSETTLNSLQPGHMVQVEYDLMAKYKTRRAALGVLYS